MRKEARSRRRPPRRAVRTQRAARPSGAGRWTALLALALAVVVLALLGHALRAASSAKLLARLDPRAALAGVH